MSGPGRGAKAALVDIDGTLVDSNYQHALAWFRALRRHGVTCEVRVLHHLIGMGGDQIVTAVAGEEVERRAGDAIRDAEKELFREVMDEVVPLPDARRLLESTTARGLIDGWTTSEDVDATKPEPDLIEAGLAVAGGGPALMIGDSTWDCRAADRAGLPTITVLTGGYCREELLAAGAAAVFDTLADAIDGIADRDLLA